jgi:hypothetical protein
MLKGKRYLTSTIAVLAIAMLFITDSESIAQNNRAYISRTLAPGVVIDIPSNVDARDSFSLPMPLPNLNLNKYEPKEGSVDETLYGLAHRVIMFRDVWQLDFAFKGLRQAEIKIASADGTVGRRNVWYMVYRIRDLGETMTYEKVKDNPEFDLVRHELKQGEKVADESRYFLPRFSLEGWVFDLQSKTYKKVAYRDTFDPMAVQQIQNLEDPGRKLLDGIQMSKAKIPEVTADSDVGVWGVAIWQDVDPQLDYVSVYASGLTNAYRIVRKDDAISFKRKTLQLNFFRAGDTIDETRDRVKYGIPLVDDPREQILITRRYDLPGPLIRGYEVKTDTNREVLVVEVDGMVDLKSFESALAPVLDKGNLPTAVTEAFANAGYTVDKEVGVEKLIEGRKWVFKQGATTFILGLEPQFWEPNYKGIRFIKSLDHMWIYR